MAFLGLVSWSLFVDACRLLSVCVFLVCSLTFSWYSFISLICLLVSLYVLDRGSYIEPPKTEQFLGGNPYKRKRRVQDEGKIPLDVRDKYVEKILDLVLYDHENCQALSNFEVIKRNTHCIFSKKSFLWGAHDYDRSLTIEQNVLRSLPTLIKFFAVGAILHLEGFVFELPGDDYGQDVNSFGEGMRRVLKCISDHDPKGFYCMNKSYVSKVGWSFEFNGEHIFVTSFAPCYPDNHSRYAFGAENAFILLQPMYSFAIHDIGKDTPHTNWEHPVTVRDKIRVAYKENNRAYFIRDTVYYPAAHDIVKPLKEGVGELVRWWKVGSTEDSATDDSEGQDSDTPSDDDSQEAGPADSVPAQAGSGMHDTQLSAEGADDQDQ